MLTKIEYLGVVILVLEMRGDELDTRQSPLRLGRLSPPQLPGPAVIRSRQPRGTTPSPIVPTHPRITLLGFWHPDTTVVVLTTFVFICGQADVLGSPRSETGLPDISAAVAEKSPGVVLPRICARRLKHAPAAVGLLPPPVFVVWPTHEQQDGQVPEEGQSDPPRHPVGPGRPEIPVDDDDCDDDCDDVHDECEEEIPGDQRDGCWGRWEDLGDEQEEDDEGKKDGDAHGHLLSSIRWEVEHADAEEGDEDARDDQVDRVEQGLPADLQNERDLGLEVHLERIPRSRVDPRTPAYVPRPAVDVVA